MRSGRLCGPVLAVLVLVSWTFDTSAADLFSAADFLDRYDVTWTHPSQDSFGSMPIGNGDIGLNVWVEENGSLAFYIGKTDAWSENARLLKLGRVRVKLLPNPFSKDAPFAQQLRLRNGEIVIRGGQDEQAVTIRVWVDAHHPVVELDIEAKSPLAIQADLQLWRNERRELKGGEMFSAYGLRGSPKPIFVEPDTVVDGSKDRVIWYHRNERSIWKENLELQGLQALSATSQDPLLKRTFGGAILGEGLVRAGRTRLKSAQPSKRCRIRAHLLTSQTDTAEGWVEQLKQQIARIEALDHNERATLHRKWWADFWNRSWIFVTGDAQADVVTRGYTLQRFINACAGRGRMPIKFNGSLFNVDALTNRQRYDADYRDWGGAYWFQNTRFPYWPMLACGDFDLMQPLFRMYLDSLALAKRRTQLYFGHSGAFWPETTYFWGAYVSADYGWDRAGKPEGVADNPYVRYHWIGGMELVAMMLDYYAITRDGQYLADALIPLADEVIAFYDEHYSRDERGRMQIRPAQALETYWESVNPAPEIAGLRHVLPRLLQLPPARTTPRQRARWQRVLDELPPLPMRQINSQRLLGFADEIGPKHNSENPELYAIFPFRLFGMGKPHLDLARRTFEHRVHRGTGGWQQDAIQAAMLGLGEEAAQMITKNFSTKNPQQRFAAFWGKNFDWTPDQTHGCVAMIALQRMLMQTDGEKLLLLPAWPKKWDVAFKLHAPNRTTVQAEYRDGRLDRYEVTPSQRAKDVVIIPPDS